MNRGQSVPTPLYVQYLRCCDCILLFDDFNLNQLHPMMMSNYIEEEKWVLEVVVEAFFAENKGARAL